MDLNYAHHHKGENRMKSAEEIKTPIADKSRRDVEMATGHVWLCDYETTRKLEHELLDAKKEGVLEGLRMAAELIPTCKSACECSQSVGWKESQEAILSLAEQVKKGEV